MFFLSKAAAGQMRPGSAIINTTSIQAHDPSPELPAELAPAYVFLASDEASYICGAVLPVTGGRPML